MYRKTLLAAAAVVALGILAIFATGCDSTGNNTQNEAVISAINILDKAGLHDIDTSISNDKKIPATAHATALHLQAVVTLTDWPQDLKDPAKKLAALLDTMAKALNGDKPDLKAAGDAAHNVHEAGHDFSSAVYKYLYKQAKITDPTASKAGD